ncbi:MAG: hypothetical protein JO257_03345 [Deltaproteobacteria bacterium]|nr:hypothetical protein [Deltaproteobacteria bacterium]
MRTWMAVLLLAACSSDPAPNADRPSEPDQNDPSFTVQGAKSWYLIGDGVTPDEDTMTVMITAPAHTSFVDAYVGDHKPVRMHAQDGGFAMQVSIADITGDTDVVFSANGSSSAFASVPFHRSSPYYVLVSTDYDFSDPSDSATQSMDLLHANHPGLRITHFWAPYTYTDPMVTAQRADQLTQWILKQKTMFNDEIGLHIHPYCNFVQDAGVTCITNASDVNADGNDLSGYTIRLEVYQRDPMATLLQHAFDIFQTHGLGHPQTFRAGGWTADLNTFLALNDKGFIADTSALNWARIEEWQGHNIYDWTMAHWSAINDTSQPYMPTTTDVLGAAGTPLNMLEVPDNGVMIDYVTTMEMTGIFDANWDPGKALAKPKTLMMGFHPSDQFAFRDYARVNDSLKYIDMHLASKDLGPVVYTTLSDVTPVFETH